MRIRMMILPGDDCDVDALLSDLAGAGLIVRYSVDNARYIAIPTWAKHQHPHHREADSTIPPPPENTQINPQQTDTKSLGLAQGQHRPRHGGAGWVMGNGEWGMGKGGTGNGEPFEADVDDLNIPPLDTGGPALTRRNARAREKPEKPTATRTSASPPENGGEVWEAYAKAYHDRYGVDPVKNGKGAALACKLVDRLGPEASYVAAWYVRHNGEYYVKRAHDFAVCVGDAEKLRTEWATGRMVTATQARQADRTQSNANAVEEVKAYYRERGELT